MVSIYGSTDKFMLKQMLDESEVGFYSTAVSLCNTWVFLLTAIIDSLYPGILQAFENKKLFERKNKQLYAIVFYVSVSVSLLFSLLASPIIGILYGEAYAPEKAKDGYNFDGWYLDTEYKTKFDFENSKATENIVLYAKFTKIQYGDVNCDGQVDITDVTYIRRYLTGYVMPNDVNVRNADVNGDGRVTQADYVLLKKYLADYYKDKNLPNESFGKTYIIEYIVDDETYKIDYELEGYKLTKPSDPIKEGYTFVGWYLDTEYKTEFDFENIKASKNIELYAKFTKN